MKIPFETGTTCLPNYTASHVLNTVTMPTLTQKALHWNSRTETESKPRNVTGQSSRDSKIRQSFVQSVTSHPFTTVNSIKLPPRRMTAVGQPSITSAVFFHRSIPDE